MKAIVIWKRGDKKQESISEDDALDGYILFYQYSENDPVSVTIYLDGLKDGKHGIHIHEKSLTMEMIFEDEVKDCCNKLGGHFNIGNKWSPEDPTGTPHGQHTGDLCMNIYVENREVDTIFFDDKISLFPGSACIIGKSIVIHENEDDLGEGVYSDEELEEGSKITGNSGDRVACGNIVVV